MNEVTIEELIDLESNEFDDLFFETFEIEDDTLAITR